MTTNVSTLSRQLSLNAALQSEQSNLATLNAQLDSGQQSESLTGYSPTDASQLLDFQNAVTQRQSYLSSMTTVQARLSVYSTTMSDMENTASTAQSLASGNLTYNSTTASNIASQVTALLQQTASDLNQQVGDRYIYAGTRYSTAPVTDLLSLTDTIPTTTTTGSILPDYDTDYSSANPSATSASAYTTDSVLVDNNYSVNYGATSTNPAFQQLISGLRLMNAAVTAGQSGDTSTYAADMQQAATLLTSANTGIQNLNTNVASAQNTLTNETTTQKADITNLQNQISNIQSVDLTTVGTEINLLTTQLQASYSATASFEQLSLVKYL